MRNKLSATGVGEILGSDWNLTYKDGDNFFTVRVKKNGKWVSRKVQALSEKETKGLKVHGPASGMGVGHCIYMASKYWKEFKEKVHGYRIVPSDRKDCPVSMLFYSRD